MKKAKRKMKKDKLQYWRMKEMFFADYMVILVEKKKDLQFNLNVFNETLIRINIQINIGKQK